MSSSVMTALIVLSTCSRTTPVRPHFQSVTSHAYADFVAVTVQAEIAVIFTNGNTDSAPCMRKRRSACVQHIQPVLRCNAGFLCHLSMQWQREKTLTRNDASETTSIQGQQGLILRLQRAL